MAKKPPPPYRIEFAKRLVKAREAFGMKTDRPELDKAEFAKMLGLEAQTYRRYELAETEPNIQTLQKIREITGFSLDTLIYGEPANVPKESTSHTPMKLHRRAS